MVMDGDAAEVARKYRWFAHNLAQGDEEKAAGLLRDAVLEGESQRRAEQLFPAADPEPATAKRTRDVAPEFEPDPFTKAYDRSTPSVKKPFPATIFPHDDT